MPKSKEFVSESDSGSDYDEPKPKKKKDSSDKKKSSKSEGNSGDSSGGVKGPGGETMYPIAKMRFVSACSFHGKKMVNIREYYNDASGELKPGKKGISLMRDQWEKLKELQGTIDEALDEL